MDVNESTDSGVPEAGVSQDMDVTATPPADGMGRPASYAEHPGMPLPGWAKVQGGL